MRETKITIPSIAAQRRYIKHRQRGTMSTARIISISTFATGFSCPHGCGHQYDIEDLGFFGHDRLTQSKTCTTCRKRFEFTMAYKEPVAWKLPQSKRRVDDI